MSDLSLAAELSAVVRLVPGVAAAYSRPGVSQLARQVLGTVRRGSEPASPVALVRQGDRTTVSVDVATAPGRSGPAVARAVAEAVRGHLAAAGVPGAAVDVRIVALV